MHTVSGCLQHSVANPSARKETEERGGEVAADITRFQAHLRLETGRQPTVARNNQSNATATCTETVRQINPAFCEGVADM